MYFELVYMSRAQSPLLPRDLNALLEQARVGNASLGISGVLLYQSGSFVQLLEGEEPAVRELFNKIKRDPRHSRVTQLYAGYLLERHFADWSMGFVDTDRLDGESAVGLSNILSSDFDDSELQALKAASVDILLYFKHQF
ncbi:BLUF domain-containing protein [Shewanella sp. GXUN23E]|uniref:BLUF domain-containing protein n=1 Tax=Shewanella sp. GXUN23E TaxID=3422498 RepID=UPI003D7D1693